MMVGKKTLGRRKIRMEKIEKKGNLQVAFSKRRMGLFKKAAELSVVCGAEIAILVQSPAGKMFTFGSPSVESILMRLETGAVATNCNRYWEADADADANARAREYYERSKYREALDKLEREKEKMKKIGKGGMELWWEKEIEGIVQVEELEQLSEAMEVLMREVTMQIDHRKKNRDHPNGDDNEHQIHGDSSSTAAVTTINDYPAAVAADDDDEFGTLLRHLLEDEEEESQPHNNNSNINWELENAHALFDFASFNGRQI